ncbi:MAG: insulinase family protein [Phycisphaerales bacterium]|nr:insulinase family protein [Phycisphaerales bacterium]MCB9857239.1 insulinase family protein [Phycisphaerales bacterium]
MERSETYHHRRLDCGIEFAALEMPGRHTVALNVRVAAGMVDEHESKLGLGNIVEQTITKGTDSKSARDVSDAFDAIGAQFTGGVGRQSTVFRCSCLPEYLDRAGALIAEVLRTPTFPEDSFAVAVQLAQQELTAMEDDPQELASRLIARHAYGPRLGRHELGTKETLAAITRDDVVEYWKNHYGAARMQICVGGAIDVDAVAKAIDKQFQGFGNRSADAFENIPVEFSAGVRHQDKALEQEHILMCWPGVSATDPEHSVERVMLGILSGGMSSRLFTEVREKQGLVYWVGAWNEHPRGAGMMFAGASTTPARCDQTARTLLREIDRLAEDITHEELERSKIGITAKMQTHGDITRARVGELSGDIYHHGRPIGVEERKAEIEAVTIDDVRRYLATHPRDKLCVQTLGPRALEEFRA